MGAPSRHLADGTDLTVRAAGSRISRTGFAGVEASSSAPGPIIHRWCRQPTSVKESGPRWSGPPQEKNSLSWTTSR